MSRGMGFGIGAGAVSLLAMVLALIPAVRGDADSQVAEGGPKKVERKRETKVDRQVRVLMRGGSYLGVRLQDLDQEDVTRLKLAEEKGALVERVEEDSPAEKAGLQADDVIVRYHGEAVIGASQLARLVAETPAGRTVPVEVMRGGAVQKLSATIGDHESAFDFGKGGDWSLHVPSPPELPEAPLMPNMPSIPNMPLPPSPPKAWGDHRLLDRMVWFGQGPRKLGLDYQEIAGQLADYFKLAGDEGVLVTNVEADGPAAKAGVKAGDVILKLGSREIEDGEDLRRALEKAESGRETTLTVQRDGRPLELKLVPAGPRRERDRSGTDL